MYTSTKIARALALIKYYFSPRWVCRGWRRQRPGPEQAAAPHRKATGAAG
jgi:hypothetical protein